MNLQSIKIPFLLLVLLLSVSAYAGGGPELPTHYQQYYENLPFRLTALQPDTPVKEALILLSEAETVVRTIVVLDISEEGGHDYMIGQFVEKIIEMERWDVVLGILENHFYYPQASSWVFEILSHDSGFRKAGIGDVFDERVTDERKLHKTVQRLRTIIKESQSQ